MIVWNEKVYDETALPIAALFHLDRYHALSRLIEKQTTIFNDARLSLEAMMALRDKSDFAIRAELEQVQPVEEPVAAPI